MTSTTPDGLAGAEATAGDDLLLPELVAHLREHRTQLRREWANRITDESLLSAMTPQEVFTEATSVYDNYVGVLETGSVEALQDYARDLSERIIPRGVETNEVVGIVLLLRDVLARSLFEKYHDDFGLLNRVLDAYEPAANRIANTVAVSFVQERERIIRQQADAIRELSTPVLQVRERLLIVEALQDYARDLSERIIPRGVETEEVVGIVLLLRDVLARSLFEKYHKDFGLLNRVLDAYEPAANRIANTVAVSFVQERERVIRQQADAIRELSTPVLQVRERLLILPIIGVLDDQRADQLTEQLLGGIRRHRAKVVVIDITGVPEITAEVANHLVQAVDASRLMGAGVIITGLSPEIAQTLVTIGVDLTKMNTVGDLQGGIEEAERLLGFRVTRVSDEDG